MEVVEEDGFQDLLDGVRQRIDDIESLHRTSELMVRAMQDGRPTKLKRSLNIFHKWKASSQGDLLRVYVEKKPPPKPES